MGQLRDRMVEDLKLAGYSPETAKVYLHYGKELTKHFRRSPSEMGEEEVRSFLLHLLEVRRLSHGSYRQCFAALKFLYRVTLKRILILRAQTGSRFSGWRDPVTGSQSVG